MYNTVIHSFEGYISNILNAYTRKMIVQILSLISFLSITHYLVFKDFKLK